MSLYWVRDDNLDKSLSVSVQEPIVVKKCGNVVEPV